MKEGKKAWMNYKHLLTNKKLWIQSLQSRLMKDMKRSGEGCSFVRHARVGLTQEKIAG